MCQDCRSVNSAGANNCYRCWVPRRFAEAREDALPVVGPGGTVQGARELPARPTLEDHRSSRRRSWILLGFLSVTVGFSALSLTFLQARGGSLGMVGSILSGDWTTFGSVLAISLVGAVLSILTAIAWFFWFDRVLVNVPALTGRWPEVGRVGAVAWWFVPIGGVFKAVFVVGHVFDLMIVPGSPGLWLLGLWGITWIGGTIAPGVVSFVAGFLPFSLEEMARLNDLISNLGQFSYIAAGFFAAALVLAVEHARDVRASGRGPARAAPGQDPTDRPEPEPGSSPWGQPWGGPGPQHPVPEHSEPQPQVPEGPAPRPPVLHAPPPQHWGGHQEPAPQASVPQASVPQASVPQASGWQGPTWQAPEQPGWQGHVPPPAWQGSAGPPGPVVPVTNADPFQAPADVATKRQRPIPFEPLVAMGVLVAAGVVAGLTFAGSAPPPPDVDLDDPASWMLGFPTPTPTRPTVPIRLPVPSQPSATPSGPTPTPAPATVVARRLVRTVTAERYRGRMTVAATYLDGSDTYVWDLEFGRAGDTEWRHIRVDRPGEDDDVDLEQAILARTVWEREYRTDWVRRTRTADDRPFEPLFNLDDQAQLTFSGLTEEDGAQLYRFSIRSGDTRLQRFIQRFGARDDLWLRSADVVVTDRGAPVRLDVVYIGSDGVSSLSMTIRYFDVGADIEVRSPREGPPLVVRGS